MQFNLSFIDNQLYNYYYKIYVNTKYKYVFIKNIINFINYNQYILTICIYFA